ncbi:AMP-binding protein, partial [Sansalvadorimonas verongulae]|uniref:AMP-binding protein n=1 Tax=Sansalvadorimonas verongulae TaxID=2172824 RepID=UPI0012BBFA82
AGATLILPDSCLTQAPPHWRKQIVEHEVTVWNTVPALADLLVEDQEPDSLPTLRLALLSGDWIPLDLPDKLRATMGSGSEILALGGATEAAIWSNSFSVMAIEEQWSSIPYGTPLGNQ